MSAVFDSTEKTGGTPEGNGAGSIPIVHQVFGAFADALAAQPGRSEVAARLRKALITDGARSEAILRAALLDGGVE